MDSHSLYVEALTLFKKLFKDMGESNVKYPNSAQLATSSGNGAPLVRTILVKDVNEQGFSFFTNIKSRKGEHRQSGVRHVSKGCTQYKGY